MTFLMILLLSSSVSKGAGDELLYLLNWSLGQHILPFCPFLDGPASSACPDSALLPMVSHSLSNHFQHSPVTKNLCVDA